MQTLLQYLAALANDPAAQDTFSQDPEAAIAAADLSAADKAVLRTGNAGLIQATVGAQAAAAVVYGSQAAPPMTIYAAAPQTGGGRTGQLSAVRSLRPLVAEQRAGGNRLDLRFGLARTVGTEHVEVQPATQIAGQHDGLGDVARRSRHYQGRPERAADR